MTPLNLRQLRDIDNMIEEQSNETDSLEETPLVEEDPGLVLDNSGFNATCPYCHGRHSTREEFNLCREEHTEG